VVQVSSLGFVRQNFDLVVSAVAKAIIKANAKLRPARALLNQGSLFDANINRSPTA
jgi:neutral ceramidase